MKKAVPRQVGASSETDVQAASRAMMAKQISSSRMTRVGRFITNPCVAAERHAEPTGTGNSCFCQSARRHFDTAEHARGDSDTCSDTGADLAERHAA